MDGVYISDKDIAETDVAEIQYYKDHIDAKSANIIAERNKRKGDILYKLRRTGKINGIPYRIYFNSCNLEHVLYGELKDYSHEEKQKLSDDLADRYDGKAAKFIKAAYKYASDIWIICILALTPQLKYDCLHKSVWQRESCGCYGTCDCSHVGYFS